MSGTDEAAGTGCSCGMCSCKEAPVAAGGKNFCSTACADGDHKDSCCGHPVCPCGHSDCKPK